MIGEKFAMCPALKISSQGQVTIPDNIRRKLDIHPCDLVDIVELRKCNVK